MTTLAIKILLLVSFAAHLVTWRCDWLITCTSNGRFQFRDFKDNQKLSKLFEGASLKNPMASIMAGVFSMLAASFGYFALCEWMRQFSGIYAGLMFVGTVVFFVLGSVHHVIFGAIEWFYIRLSRTEEAFGAIVEFMKKTSVTMYGCYAGLLLFLVVFFAAVRTGATTLPAWACIFNILPLFLIFTPFHLVGTGNLVSAIMFLGMFFLI